MLLTSCNSCLLIEAKCSNVTVIIISTVAGCFMQIVVMTKQGKQVLNVWAFRFFFFFFSLPKSMIQSIVIVSYVKVRLFCSNKQNCVCERLVIDIRDSVTCLVPRILKSVIFMLSRYFKIYNVVLSFCNLKKHEILQ